MPSEHNKNRRTFFKQLTLIMAGTSVSSLGGLSRASAFIANSLRKARKAVPTFFAFGSNPSSILMITPAGDASTPVAITSGKSWSRLAMDENFGIGLNTDGTLWAWGQDYSTGGVHGNGTAGNTYSSPILIGSGWADVACNFEAVLAIKTDGTLWGWGRNYHDIFPNNTGSDVMSTPILIGAATSWSSISINKCQYQACNILLVRSDNWAYSYGSNESYQLGLGTTNITSALTAMPTTIWKNASVGSNHAMGVKTDNTLWGWGSCATGAQGNGVTSASTYRSTPVKVGTAVNWATVSSGNNCSLMLKTDRTLWFTGDNTYGTAGNASVVSVSTPVQVGVGTAWSKISLMEYNALALQTNGTLWAWGENSVGESGISSAAAIISTPVQIGVGTDWADVSAGYYHCLALKTDGSMWAWGGNGNGQLGNNSSTDLSSPVRVGTSTWKKAAAGIYMSAGIRSDGTLWAWGSIGGFTDYIQVSNPVQFSTDTSWVDVKCGHNVIVFANSSGGLYTIGQNHWAQLGCAPDTRYSTPVQMGSATDWKRVAFKDWQVVALKTAGTLWNWGWIFTTGDHDYAWYRAKTPVQVGVGTDWVDIDACSSTLMALKTGGTLWAWGVNLYKNGSFVGDSSVPLQVGTGTTWKKFALNQTAAYALKTDGTLWSWGQQNYGELGRGAVGATSIPTQIGAKAWTDLAANGWSAGAILTDGTLFCWGRNGDGQLGDATTTNRSSPVKVGTATNWKKVFIGKYSGFGRRDN